MVLFMPPETCKELGLASALGEHAPASPHVPTHHLPIANHNAPRRPRKQGFKMSKTNLVSQHFAFSFRKDYN